MVSGIYKRTKNMKTTLIDLTGKKFGRLTGIKRSYPNDKWGNSRWLFKCDCGKEKIIRGESVSQGYTKSCGCLGGNKKKLDSGLASMRKRISEYKRSAKKRGLKFKLTEEQFYEMTQKDCFYCGEKPKQISHHNGCNGDYIYNGLDRQDSTRGYEIDNVVPCCRKCNRAKDTSTLQEFKDWAEKLYGHLVCITNANFGCPKEEMIK